MRTWKGQITVCGDGRKYYVEINVPISDELYEQISSVVESGGLIADNDDIHAEVYGAIEDNWSVFEEIYPEYSDDEAPNINDFDSKEEYEEELEAFNEEKAEALEEYEDMVEEDTIFLEDVVVFDPNAEKEFKKKFIGHVCPEKATGKNNEETYDFEQEEGAYRHHVTVCFDKEGQITDLKWISLEAFEYSTPRRDCFADIYPDYNTLFDFLEDELF